MLFGSEKRGNIYCKKLGNLFFSYDHVDVFTGLTIFLSAKKANMIQEDGHVRLTFYIFLFCVL